MADDTTKKLNLAEQLKESKAHASALEGKLAASATKADEDSKALVAMEERATKAEASLAAAATKADEDSKAIVALEERATKAEADLGEANKKLANPGQAYGDASPGKRTPVAEGGSTSDGGSGGEVISWAEARKSCGGSYSEARRKHPESFAAAFPDIAAKAAAQAKASE